MDNQTLDAYTKLAEQYSQDWLSQPAPEDIYQLLKKYFIPDGVTADIGCGNGRDTSWMAQNGFKASGYDASLELINLAKKLYPKIEFSQSFFPQLKEINQTFDNVYCETVIMHLPKEEIVAAVQSLKRILKPKGILYLSWRVTEGQDTRHADGRLYSAFDPKVVTDQFAKEAVLHFEDVKSVSSGKRVCRLIVKN